jgi:hypothetical protein
LQCPDSFLQSLPANILAEAQQVRERFAFNRRNFDAELQDLETFFHHQFNTIQKQQKLINLDTNYLNLIKNFRKNRATNKFLEVIIRKIYLTKNLENFPYTLTSALIFHAENEHKIMDAFLFILGNPHMDTPIREVQNGLNIKDGQFFPPTTIITNGSEIQDYKKVYNIISDKILTIMLKLTESHVYSFLRDYINRYESEERQKLEEMHAEIGPETLDNRNLVSLPSIQGLKECLGLNESPKKRDMILGEKNLQDDSGFSSNLFTN